MSTVSVMFRAHVPCVICGYQRPVARFSTVVVLATRLRDEGMSLTAGPGDCRECGWPEEAWAGSLPQRWQLNASDRAKIDAVHARKFPARHRSEVAS